jgi:hypothetical protein
MRISSKALAAIPEKEFKGAPHTPEALAADELEVFLQGGDSTLGRVLEAREKGLRRKFDLGKPVPLTKRCSEQFGTRKALASCTLELEPVGAVHLAIYSTTLTDKRMQLCLKAQGEWKELDQNSLEVGHQRRMEMLRAAQSALGDSTPN